MSQARVSLRCGSVVGLVLLGTLALAAPAGATSSDPLTPPSGWFRESSSGYWDYGSNMVLSWNLVDANGDLVSYNYEMGDNERPADSIFLDVFYSKDRVSRVGETVDYQIVVRRAPEPFNPLPQSYPGARLDPYEYGASVRIDLAGIVDNAVLTTSDFAVDEPGATLSFGGTHLTAYVPFTDSDVVTISFSAVYDGRGDDEMGMHAQLEQMFPNYSATTEAQVSVDIAAPSFDVFKTASVDEVTAAGDEVTYSVRVDRREGGAQEFVFTDEMPEVLAVAEDFTVDDIDLPAGLTDDVVITEQGFTFVGVWPIDPNTGLGVDSVAFDYTVTYNGGGERDDLVNTACVTARELTTCDDAVVAVGSVVAPPVTTPAPQTTDGPEGDSKQPSAAPGADGELAATGGAVSFGAFIAGVVAIAAGAGLMRRKKVSTES